MAYTDINTPVIQKIHLPSGTQYYVADREIRDKVEELASAVAGGVKFITAWDGTSTPVVANIPKGVVVKYNGTNYTGTLQGADAEPGSFYLVKSSTLPSSQTLDIYEEYAFVSGKWQKMGDTQLNLTDVVTDVSLTKQTDTVIGTDSTFTITQPTVSLATDTTSGTGKVQVVTGVSGGSLGTDDIVTALTGLGTPSTASVVGKDATFSVTQPTITLADTATTGGVNFIAGVSNTNVKATASGGGAAWNSKDQKTVVTGYTPDDDTFVKTISATSQKLVTTSLTGVSGSTSVNNYTRTGQTTATGATTASTSNDNILKGVSVSNGVLTFGAATLNTQTTGSVGSASSVTVPVAAANATTVATGKVAASDSNGATVVTAASAGSSGTALTDLGTPTTATVIGSASTFTNTQPTIALATGATAGTGVVSLTNAAGSTKHLTATATNGAVAWANQKNQTVVTGYANTTTDNVLGEDTTIAAITPTKTYIKATASGANTAWNNKDSVTVLKNTTDVNVTKGS